jgi:hypothetical protein
LRSAAAGRTSASAQASPGPSYTRWRFNRVNKLSSTSYEGLKDSELWQQWLWKGAKLQEIKQAKLREMDFWAGD